ncbi:uncharacterized protein LOC141689988 [Apium graveolens]|uniref:uncharacterized protein LOC141689988 n=1 Tax=Apium graveolens TaxID=4045 RepID=UPI003D7A7D3D
MATYLALSASLLEKIPSWAINNVFREENQWAEALSKLASSVVSTAEAIYITERNSQSIDVARVNKVSTTVDWRQPILENILQDKIPLENNATRTLIYKAINYCVLNNKLYRRSLVEPLLRCLGPEEAHTSIVEVHTGSWGDYLGGKNLALNIIRQGLFWTTMRSDSENFV